MTGKTIEEILGSELFMEAAARIGKVVDRDLSGLMKLPLGQRRQLLAAIQLTLNRWHDPAQYARDMRLLRKIALHSETRIATSRSPKRRPRNRPRGWTTS